MCPNWYCATDPLPSDVLFMFYKFTFIITHNTLDSQLELQQNEMFHGMITVSENITVSWCTLLHYCYYIHVIAIIQWPLKESWQKGFLLVEEYIIILLNIFLVSLIIWIQ